MDGIEVYYFSGTGNSLQIARKLAERLPNAKLIPIISCLGMERIETKGDAVGIVFPLHAFTLPVPVRSFLKRADLASAGYIFAAATKGGSPGIAYQDLNKMLRKKGKTLNAYFEFKAANNLIVMHGLDSPEEIAENEARAEIDLEAFAQTVRAMRDLPWKDAELNWLTEKIVFPFVGHFMLPALGQSVYPLCAGSACTGCGTCERVCLSGRIRMKGGRPEWRKDIKCCYCFACINYCPAKAIQIRRTKTKTSGRYHREGIGAEDIAAQKATVIRP